MRKRIILMLASLVSYQATAKPITFSPPEDFTNGASSFKETFKVFPISSEFQIGKIKTLIERAPEGLYLTVGSERGFRAASMLPQIKYLWLLDISDTIIRYNLINIQLLKSAKREQYLHLRWNAEFIEWQAISSILTKEDFDWWQNHVRDLKNSSYKLPEYLNRFHRSPPCIENSASEQEKKLNLGEIVNYKTGNYLFYDDLYAKIHQLAKENKIFVSKINLADKTQLTSLGQYLSDHQIKISTLDLDNLYFTDYLGQTAYRQVVNTLLPLGYNNSVLVAMSNYKDYACGQFQFYLGFTFEHIKNWQAEFEMQAFIDSIPKEIQNIMDGRLYEKDDLTPCFEKCLLVPRQSIEAKQESTS